MPPAPSGPSGPSTSSASSALSAASAASHPSAYPLRLLTAVPICDGHDSAINTINLEFVRHGIEVIYLGYHRKTTDIARAAVQEDARAIGLSSYNGGHVEFFAEVRARLRERGGAGIGLFGGGGGTITEEDAAQMGREGTDRIFFAGTPLDTMIGWVRERYGAAGAVDPAGEMVGAKGMDDASGAAGVDGADGTDGVGGLERENGAQGADGVSGAEGANGAGGVDSAEDVPISHAARDRALARRLTRIERESHRADHHGGGGGESGGGEGERSAGTAGTAATGFSRRGKCRVVGITGPGGAGKTTLIDELVLRFLRARPAWARVAILSHDPSLVGAGALLGDRATMIHAQDDRVFMRSMATRGQAGGLSPATGRCLEFLATRGEFELVLIETVGVGQEAMPFAGGLVDQTLLVMNPDYGARLQLQKIALLDLADVVAVNKSDLSGARTASAEIARRLEVNRRGQRLLATIANRHRDAGVDALFAAVMGGGGAAGA